MFDLKYRPRTFSDVLGNSAVINLLKIRASNKTLQTRSLMFGGPKGCGKTSLARIVAKSIMCDSLANGDPCCRCESCLACQSENQDYYEEFDAATQGSVERIREIVTDLDYGTVSGKPRLVILDEAHRLSKAAQDALLRPMEDRRLVIILCTTEPHLIKTAIRSRVEEYPISPPSETDLVQRLSSICNSEGLSFEEDALKIITRMNVDCPRTALTSLESISHLGPVNAENSRNFFNYDSYEEVLKCLTSLRSEAKDSLNKFHEIHFRHGSVWLRDTIVCAICSSVRLRIGAKNLYPINSTLLSSLDPSYVQLATKLSTLERPNIWDIESHVCEFLINSKVLEVIPFVPTPSVSPPLKTPVVDPPELKIRPTVRETLKVLKGQSELEVDGVKFTSDESLTSLDDQIESSNLVKSEQSSEVIGVEFDKNVLPMTEKEFARDFLERLRS